MEDRTTGNNIIVKTGNISTCYNDFGEGTATLLFIHGFPFDKSTWKPQLDFFKTIYRVITYDIRGFGKSTIDEQQLNIDLLADDLIALMDKLEVQKAIVCGVSMGGYILLNALSRYPQRFEAIILANTQCVADSTEQKEKRYETAKKIEADGLLYFTEEFVKKIFYEASFTDKTIIVDEVRAIIQSTPSQTIVKTLEALAQRKETCSALSKISIPALVICANQDKAIPPEQSEQLHKKIKNATLKRIDKAGHLANLEQSEEFNRHIANFIYSFTALHQQH